MKRIGRGMVAAQQELPLKKRKPRGGKRPRAGRKPGPGGPRMSHKRRPVVKARYPLHVTVRMKKNVPGLRKFELARVLRQAFAKGCEKEGFRICQFSIQGNHVHMICEASGNAALARGMQGWSVRMARGVNKKVKREGTVFADRYHFEIITTPRHMRNTLCYVLQNARRHGERLDHRFNGMDPFSSAMWFDGWRDNRWREGLVTEPEPPVARSRTWLMNVGWRKRGLLSIDEMPPAGREWLH
jgi:REP element-mobilizing transposase RayT